MCTLYFVNERLCDSWVAQLAVVFFIYGVNKSHREQTLTQTSAEGSSSLFIFSATLNKVEDVSQASKERLFLFISSFITHVFVIVVVQYFRPVFANTTLLADDQQWLLYKCVCG